MAEESEAVKAVKRCIREVEKMPGHVWSNVVYKTDVLEVLMRELAVAALAGGPDDGG